jgi:hypothetical protein
LPSGSRQKSEKRRIVADELYEGRSYWELDGDAQALVDCVIDWFEWPQTVDREPRSQAAGAGQNARPRAAPRKPRAAQPARPFTEPRIYSFSDDPPPAMVRLADGSTLRVGSKYQGWTVTNITPYIITFRSASGKERTFDHFGAETSPDDYRNTP